MSKETRNNLKEKLILKRLDQVYCRLAPSPIHGIGIFSIKQIPIGINPFNNSYISQESIIINKDKIKDSLLQKMLSDYSPTSDPTKQVVSSFPNQPIWTNYINYSETPNIQLMDDGEWRTLRVIEIGEELVEDPKRLMNLDGSQKIFTVRQNQYPNLSYSL